VWTIVRDFNGLGKYVPAVTNSTLQGSGPGAVRTLTTQDGGQMAERLESLDDDARVLTYSMVGASPFKGYLSTMRVQEIDANRCEFAWSSTFTPQGMSEAEAKARLEGFYRLACDGLKQLFGQ
jgi:hypothetical protein